MGRSHGSAVDDHGVPATTGRCSGGGGPPSPSNSWPFKSTSSERGTKAPPAGVRPVHTPGAAAERASAADLEGGAGWLTSRVAGRAGARVLPCSHYTLQLAPLCFSETRR